jgi:hypothetical protein
MYYSGAAAVFLAAVAWAFVEVFARLYPSRETWARLRREHGRTAVRSIRRRFEAAARGRVPRIVLGVLVALVVAWIASARLLDKRWYEVVLDVLPYALVGGAMMRAPAALRSVARRMRDYERAAGEDPDEQDGNEPIAI